MPAKAEARDSAELIDIDYTILPSVTDTAEAAEGKTAVWDECPDNISNLFESGNRAATEAAFARAAQIVKRRYVISRVYAQFMEPRGAIGEWDPGETITETNANGSYAFVTNHGTYNMRVARPDYHLQTAPRANDAIVVELKYGMTSMGNIFGLQRI